LGEARAEVVVHPRGGGRRRLECGVRGMRFVGDEAERLEIVSSLFVRVVIPG
jgi:hypothetical protein